MEFVEAGKFLKQRRKERGFKTQKAFIEALYTIDPNISCSLPYISLIEKGAKTPSVHLLDIMAQALELTPHEKGELLLIYKRVPSDFEFTVRTNLKESLKYNTLDQVWESYRQSPNKDNFNRLLRMLVLEEKTQDALELLKNAPTFSDNFVDLQIRTAHLASVSGKYDFAIQGYQMALDSCPENLEQTRGEIYMHLGIVYFAKGVKQQYDNSEQALENFLEAKHFLQLSLEKVPGKTFAIDEFARCLYHVADALDVLLKSKTPLKLGSDTPRIKSLFKDAKGPLKPTPKIFNPLIQSHFQAARERYAQILTLSDNEDLPQKPLKEAVYFYAYTHSKLKLFSDSAVLINSMIILDKNWLTYFIKAGDAVLQFEDSQDAQYLDKAIEALEMAQDFDSDAVNGLLNIEKDRELKTLWIHREKALKKLLKHGE